MMLRKPGDLPVIRTTFLGTLIVALFHTAILDAAKIEGQVELVDGDSFRVRTGSDLFPVAGDKLVVSTKVPGTDIVAEVAVGTVTKIEGTTIIAKTDRASGRIEVGHPVAIESPKPVERPVPSKFVDSVGTTLIHIPGTADLESFYLSAHEVTVKQFREFVDKTGYVTEVEGKSTATQQVGSQFRRTSELTWRTPGNPVRDNHPVRQVSWNDAIAFCKWLSAEERATYRLPDRAEWKLAFLAGAKGEFFFGEDVRLVSEYAWWAGNSDNTVHEVGLLKPNAWGLYDITGNVSEWLADPFNDKGARYISAGNYSNRAKDLGVSAIGQFHGDHGLPICGFRVLREVKTGGDGVRGLDQIDDKR